MTDLYGCNEVNPISDGDRALAKRITRTVPWTAKGLKVTRLRMLSDPGFPCWDISYCHGVLADGEAVEVELPFYQLPKYGWKRAIVNAAKRDKVFAQGIGILTNVSTLC